MPCVDTVEIPNLRIAPQRSGECLPRSSWLTSLRKHVVEAISSFPSAWFQTANQRMMEASARLLERDAATLTRPLHLSEHQRRDRLRDSSMKTLLQSGAAQIFSRSAWSVIALTALIMLGLSDAPVHEPVHARSSYVTSSCYCA